MKKRHISPGPRKLVIETRSSDQCNRVEIIELESPSNTKSQWTRFLKKPKKNCHYISSDVPDSANTTTYSTPKHLLPKEDYFPCYDPLQKIQLERLNPIPCSKILPICGTLYPKQAYSQPNPLNFDVDIPDPERPNLQLDIDINDVYYYFQEGILFPCDGIIPGS